MKKTGFGANYSRSSFTSVHGDIDIGYYSHETKRKCLNILYGIFSTDLGATNKWVKSIYIHLKLKHSELIMREKLELKVSSTHKEVRGSAKIRHFNIVKSSKEKLNINPFDTSKVKKVNTGIKRGFASFQYFI